MRPSFPPETAARLAQNARRRERARIAQDIHDDLGQSLLAVRIELASLRAGQNDVRLDGVIRNVDASIAALRAIVLQLKPSALEAGLADAARQLLEEFSRTTGLRHALEIDVPAKCQTPDSWSECAYRILQEALANCARHAGARQVDVLLRLAPGALELRIADDGCGGAGPRGGAGLPGMAARAASLGGQLRIDSPPKAGTVVHLMLGTR